MPGQADLSLSIGMTLKEPGGYVRWVGMLNIHTREIEKRRVKTIAARECKRLIKQDTGLLRRLGNYLREDVSRKYGVSLVCPSPCKGKLRYFHHR